MYNKLFLLLALSFAFSGIAGAQQHIITTVVGGGPTGIPKLQAGLSNPAAVVQDTNGNFYVLGNMTDQVFQIDPNGNVTIVAGTGTPGYTGDNGLATNAQLSNPQDISIDSSGNIFIADTGNNAIREVEQATGKILTVAGLKGQPGYNGDNIPAAQAELNAPSGVFVDSHGNIFIADTGNNRLREIAAPAGTIITVPGTLGALGGPMGVFVDQFDNIFIADSGNHAVKEVVSSSNTLVTVAGTGIAGYSPNPGPGPAMSAQLNGPRRVFAVSSSAASSVVYISDTNNNVVRQVSAGVIQTIAGNGQGTFAGDKGPATSASLNTPEGLLVDGAGDLFIADTFNYRVREVAAASLQITTFAGNGTISFSGDAGVPTNAQIYNPYGVFIDASGNIFIADTGNNVIRQVSNGKIQTIAGIGTQQSGYGGDNGPATSAILNGPKGVFVDANGNVFIADTGNHIIREVIAGTIRTVAGTPQQAGNSGENVSPTVAQLNAPQGIVSDSQGNLFISDTGNSVIREVVKQTGLIETVQATVGVLANPAGLYFDAPGNLFIADSGNNLVQEMAYSSGQLQSPQPIAGNGQAGFGGDGQAPKSAQLNHPDSVFVDRSGNVFIYDSVNHVVREVVAATQTIETIAGTGPPSLPNYSGDGGPATAASIGQYGGVYGDSNGNLLIADRLAGRVRNVAGIVTSAPANAVASGGTPQSATVNTAFGTLLSAMVTDVNGNPVSGVLVTFAAPTTGPSGAFGDGVSTATTDATGTASVSFIASKLTGSYVVTATIAGVTAPARFKLTNTAGTPTAIAATSGTPQSTLATTAFAAAFAATVTDAYGNLVPGVNVTFTAPGSGPSGTFAGSGATATVATNNSGVATSPVFTANAAAGGPYNVTATVVGAAGSALFVLTNQPQPLVITTTQLGASQQGVAYSQILTAMGGTIPYIWSIASGTLPPGLMLSSNGAITGIALSTGSYGFTVQVNDSANPSVPKTQALSINVIGVVTSAMVIPGPSAVAIGASAVQFYLQDQNGNLLPATWTVSKGLGKFNNPTNGAYSAPTDPTSQGTSVTVTATPLGFTGTVTVTPATFQLQNNGVELCCVGKVQPNLVVPSGQTRSTNPTGVQLDVPAGTPDDPFTVTCTQSDALGNNVQPMPPGSGCIFTLPPAKGGTVVTALTASQKAAFCYVFITRASSIGSAFPPTAVPWNLGPSQRTAYLMILLFALLIILNAISAKRSSYPIALRMASAILITVCASLMFLGACSSFSSNTVAPPAGQITPAGTYFVRVVVSAPSNSNFVQTQLIVPMTVQ